MIPRHMLERTKSMAVLKGLTAAYANVGDGSLPSIRHLMNHCSGLPETTTSDTGIIEQLLRCSAESGEVNVDLEEALGLALEKRARPLFPPGTQFHRSNLGIAILRMMLPGDGQSLLRQCAGELGMPTLCFPQHEGPRIRYAPSCDTVPSHISLHDPECPGYDVHTASARVDEVAQFLAGSAQGCKHSWTGGEGSKRYGFLPQMLVPKVAVHRQSGHYHG